VVLLEFINARMERNNAALATLDPAQSATGIARIQGEIAICKELVKEQRKPLWETLYEWHHNEKTREGDTE